MILLHSAFFSVFVFISNSIHVCSSLRDTFSIPQKNLCSSFCIQQPLYQKSIVLSLTPSIIILALFVTLVLRLGGLVKIFYKCKGFPIFHFFLMHTAAHFICYQVQLMLHYQPFIVIIYHSARICVIHWIYCGSVSTLIKLLD